MNRVGSKVAFHATSVLLAAMFLFPIAWTIIASVTGDRATGGEGAIGVENYERVAEYGHGIGTYLANSTIVAALTVAGTVVIAALGGYALSRFKFPGKVLLYAGALLILTIPHPTILIPLYQVMRWVGLQNSLVGLAIVLIMFQLPFSLFLMQAAFDAVPHELDESAMLDGCNRVTALLRVLLPAVVPATVTIGLFAFLNSWNEFIAPLILLADGTKFTLPIALVNLRSGDYGATDVGALQAGIVVSALPCLILFVILQRYYVRGITAGAVKG